MDTATDRSLSPKRVRFDPTADTGTEQKTPMALARSQIKTHLESLHPDLQPLLSKAALDHLMAMHGSHHKRAQVTKMESTDEYIPSSARLKFRLTVSKAVEQAPEFQALKDETDALVANIQQELKAKIIAAAKLEITVQDSNVVNLLAVGISKTVNAMLIMAGKSTEDTHKMANTILNTHHE